MQYMKKIKTEKMALIKTPKEIGMKYKTTKTITISR